MKRSHQFFNSIILLFAISPLVYLLFIWSTVPETIITRFTINEPIEKVQSRQTLLIAVIVVSITSAGVYLLMRNLHKVDPKVRSSTPVSAFNRLGLAITVFLVLLNYFFILSAMHSWEISKKAIYIFLGLLLAVLGNYMYNIKPNFFAGIRLPWTLSSEDNWRQTHHLAAKLWFTGGTGLAIAGWFLPETVLKPVFITVILLGVLIPGVYSYLLYKRKK